MTAFEAALFACVAAIALLRPEFGARAFEAAERRLRPLTATGLRGLLGVAALAILVRAVFLPVLGPPPPLVADEHSLLLQARTFLEGRWVSPPHPLWPHFETVHVNQQPTYASIYFPGRSAPLLLGELLGHPWIGVWAVFAAACAAVTWMLAGYVPRGWAVLGGALVALRFGAFSYWINSYWGGAFVALGGALVAGAIPRLIGRPNWRDGLALAAGLLILMTARPFEGLFFALPFAAVFALSTWRSVRGGDFGGLVRAASPALAAVLLGAALLATYNARSTGDPWKTAYGANREQYALAPAFLAAPPLERAHWPNEHFERFYAWEAEAHRRGSSVQGVAKAIAGKARRVWEFFLGPILTVPALVGLFVLVRRRETRAVAAAGAGALAAYGLVTWDFPHYLAPALGVVFLGVVEGLRRLRTWRFRDRPSGLALSRLVPLALAVALLLPALQLVTGAPLVEQDHAYKACCALEDDSDRARLERALSRTPGRDLVIVRYRPTDSLHSEWVYNAPDIDGAEVVWARDLGPSRNAELQARWPDRRVWLLDGVTDPKPVEIRPAR